MADKDSSKNAPSAAVLTVVEGKDKGVRVELEKGACSAVGRSLDEPDRTRTSHPGSALLLDDQSRKVVQQYLSRFQGSKNAPESGPESGNDWGGFRRGPDIRLKDPAVSRLHAMIFHDASGVIGILDLVSRNGTFVNGAEVESKNLKPGDLIAMGGTKIRLGVAP